MRTFSLLIYSTQYKSQTTLSSSHSFSSSQSLFSLSLLTTKTPLPMLNHSLFQWLFSLFTILLYPQIEESRVVGLILGFFWNFWFSWWSMLPPLFWVCSFLAAGSVMEQVGVFYPFHCIALSPNWRLKGCWFNFGFHLEFLGFSVERASSLFLGLWFLGG